MIVSTNTDQIHSISQLTLQLHSVFRILKILQAMSLEYLTREVEDLDGHIAVHEIL